MPKLKSLLYSGFKSTISSSAILWGKHMKRLRFANIKLHCQIILFCVNREFMYRQNMGFSQHHLMALS